jgi:hypothetical protein
VKINKRILSEAVRRVRQIIKEQEEAPAEAGAEGADQAAQAGTKRTSNSRGTLILLKPLPILERCFSQEKMDPMFKCLWTIFNPVPKRRKRKEKILMPFNL